MEFEPDLYDHNVDLHTIISRPVSRISATMLCAGFRLFRPIPG